MYKLSWLFSPRRVMILVLLLVAVMVGCMAGPRVKSAPGPSFSQEQYLELSRKGDESFSLMHLYGWRRAEEYYEKAYGMNATPELRDKRFLTLCLIALREKEEQVVNPRVYEKLDELGDFPRSPKQELLAGMVNHYRSLGVIRNPLQRIAAKEKRGVDVSLFDIKNSPLDLYLYLQCVDYYAYNLQEYNGELVELLKRDHIVDFMKQYEMSPLFVYLNPKAIQNREKEVEEKNPGFAEFFVRQGNVLFKENKLKKAGNYYQNALSLIPDYPNAINAMGNIYYFTVKDFQTALDYYSQTLELDALNPVALFGKGVTLHYLEKYMESNEVLQFMLENQEMYHGEANYYMGYNWFHMKDPVKTRQYVEQAKKLMPESGEVFFLSGLVYYQAEEYKKAEEDFLHTLWDRSFSPCFSLYYIGMIKAKGQDWSFFKDFNDSIGCFNTASAGMERWLAGIDLMDIEEEQKIWMKSRERQKLDEYKQNAQVLSSQMTTIMETNKEGLQAYRKQQKEGLFNKVKEALEKNPGQLNARIKDGATYLQQAVENGHLELVNYLIARGADVNLKDVNGYTPLHWSVLLGRVDIARRLIESGADVNVKTNQNMTPLHDAAYNGNKGLVELLLASGARLDERDGSGYSPLSLAIEHNQVDILELLKPLHVCITKGDMGLLRELIEKYPGQLNALDEKSRTPLHIAAELGATKAAWELIEAGAEINARDLDGYTPLELARRNNQEEMVGLLLSRGAYLSNEEILTNKLGEKEAITWYLGGNGWAIKTKNYFLVFDYIPRIKHPGQVLPKEPLLANGQLNPREISSEQLVILESRRLLNVGIELPIMELEKELKNITYISQDKPAKSPGHYSISSGETLKIKDLVVSAFKSTDNNIGFLVCVDGLVIIHGGNHLNWEESNWNVFSTGINDLEALLQGRGVDIMFLQLPLGAEKMGVAGPYQKGINYAVERLKPRVFIPLIDDGSESVARWFIKENDAKKSKTQFISPVSRGDRLVYRGGQMGTN